MNERRYRIAAATLGVVLVLRALLPLALERAIEWSGSRSVGVPVSLDDLDLQILRGGVTLEGLRVAGVDAPPGEDGGIDPETALLSLERLAANLQWLSLLRGRLHLAELTVARPRIAVELDRYGNARLPAPETETEAEEVAEDGEPPQAEDGEPEADAAPEANAAGENSEAVDASQPPGESGEPDEPEAGSGWPIQLDRFAIENAVLRVRDPFLRGEEPAIELGFGAFDLSELAYEDGGIALGGMGLAEPRLHVRRDYVLAKRPPAPQAAAAPETGPPGRAHRVERLGIERAEFTLITDGGPLEVALAFGATGLTTAHGERFPVRVDLEIGGGHLELAGQAGIEPPAFAGQLAWNALPVPELALAADPALAGWLRSASASGRLELRFDPGVENALVVEGEARVDGFEFAQPDGDEVSVRWKSLSVALARTRFPTSGSDPAEIDLARVDWVAPQARYTLPAPALAALLAGETSEKRGAAGEAVDAAPTADEANEAVDEAPTADAPDDVADETPTADAPDDVADETPAPAAPPPTRVRLRALQVRDGDVHFVDRTVEPPYEGRLAKLEISASELRLPENRGKSLRIAGQAPGGADFSLEGAPSEGGRLVFELERLGLGQFDAYTANAVGYRTSGDATLKTEIELGSERIDVGNRLVLHQIGMQSTGEAILDQMIGMPVDLALALLRDVGGDIRLGIPLTVERDGVRVSIGGVIRDAVRAAIAGAVMAPLKIANTAASPLRALGGALTGNSRLSPPPLEFVPGTLTPTEEAAERLQALADLMESRPQILLVLHGRSHEDDRDGLARRMLIEAVQAGDDLPEVEDAGFFARRGVRGALAAMGRGQTHELEEDERALLERYEQGVFVPPGRYDALARERAEWVKRDLGETHGIDAARLRVAEDVERGDPGVRVALGVWGGS